MNILFANYGDFATNSLNHIAGFANELCRLGHDCLVAVPKNTDSVRLLPDPLFVPAGFDHVLRVPNHFPDSRPADLIHAWTPREGVRLFVEAYQRQYSAPVVVHLEDNEERLLETYYRMSFEELRHRVPAELNPIWTRDLSHPNRFRSFIHLADGATLITSALADFLAPETPRITLNPPVDLDFFAPRPPDARLRQKLGIAPGEKVIVYHGSVTSANRGDLRKLYLAVALLNRDGIPTRLIRTGYNDPGFVGSFGYDTGSQVIDLGFVDRRELPPLLALADVLVQPGSDDSFNHYRLPSKIPEFLASGRPVIVPATNLGLQLVHEEDALLLRTGSPLEIAAACRRVFSEPDLAARLSGNAVARARESFDPESAAAALAGFYEAIIRKRDASPWKSLKGTGRDQFHLLAATASDAARRLETGGTAGQTEILKELAHAIEVEREDWKKSCVRLESAKANLEQVIQDLTQGREADRRVIETQEERILLLGKQVDDLDGQARELTADRDNVRRDAAEAHRLGRECRETLVALREDLIAARKEIDRLVERDARVRATLSWRITGPLRWLRRHFIDPFTRRKG
ncbi:MAG: glycosyltransferase [Opitutaceae bacterium]